MNIKPAILEKSFKQIESKVKIAQKVGFNFVQIDICDGVFVPSKTFGSNARKDSAQKISKLAKKYNVKIELDMMVKKPDKRSWQTFINIIKPKRVIYHLKTLDSKTPKEIFNHKCEFALALSLKDNLDKAKQFIEIFPFSSFQVMGIEKVGFGGQKLSPKVCAKIKAVKKYFPKMGIAVDGGVKIENIETLISCGANEFAMGSGFFKYKDGVKQAAEFLKKL